MYKVDTEKKDRQTLKHYMDLDHDDVYIEQFAYAKLALLDIVDNQAHDRDKERLAAIVEKLTEPDLENLQTKIDKATYELMLMGDYKATPQHQAIVNERKGRLDLTKLISRKADNKLLTNYLIVNKGMPVSRDLKNNLVANGHDELVKTIDKLQATDTREQNHHAQARVKAKSLSMKM